MQTITTVADVSRPNVLATSDQILNPLWDQCPKRYLKGETFEVDIVIATRTRVKIQVIVSDSNGVFERFRFGRILGIA